MPPRILAQEYVERYPVDQLELHPRNARRGSVGALERLLEANGFYGAIVVQRSTRFVLAGNHRLMAAREAGLVDLPVFLVDVDDDEARDILLGDNRGSDMATYDAEQLAGLLAEAMTSARGLAGTGYSPVDVADLLAGLKTNDTPAGNNDPDDVPPVPDVPMSEVGDVWLLGRHRLAVGDARDPLVVERALNGRFADLVWTDPPYGLEYEGKTADKLTIVGDGGDPAALELLLRSVLGNARTWCRPGGAWYVTGPPGPNMAVFSRVLSDLKVWRQTLVWVKDRFVLGRQDFHYRHELVYAGETPTDPDQESGGRLDPEMVFMGWKPGAAHRRPPTRKLDTVWEIPRPAASEVHPTMKPVELVERAVRNSSTPGEMVLDPFAGSGSTLIACYRAGRHAALVELDPGYADVICRRWEAHTGDVPRLEATGEPRSFVVAD